MMHVQQPQPQPQPHIAIRAPTTASTSKVTVNPCIMTPTTINNTPDATATTTTTRIAHLVHVNTDAAASMVRASGGSSHARQSSLCILSRGLAQILPHITCLQQQPTPEQEQHEESSSSRLVLEPLHVDRKTVRRDDDYDDDRDECENDEVDCHGDNVDRQQGIYYSDTDGLHVYARPLVVRLKHHCHPNHNYNQTLPPVSSSNDFSLADLELLASVMMYNMALCLHVKALETERALSNEQEQDRHQQAVVLLRKAQALYEKTLRFFLLSTSSSSSSSKSHRNNQKDHFLLSLAVVNNTAHIHAHFYERSAVQHCHNWMKHALSEHSDTAISHQDQHQEEHGTMHEEISDDESTLAPAMMAMDAENDEDNDDDEDDENDEQDDEDIFDPSFFLLNVLCLDANLFCTAPAA